MNDGQEAYSAFSKSPQTITGTGLSFVLVILKFFTLSFVPSLKGVDCGISSKENLIVLLTLLPTS
jgi:hypothetical protein